MFMAGSMAAFVSSDAIMKSVSGEMSLYQAICIRGVFATTLITLLAWHQGALWPVPKGRDFRIVMVRSLADLGAALCFLTALFKIDLALIAAIVQAVPLLMTLVGALFLGHRVGWRRYAAILAGFAGVLMIIKPGSEGFNVYSLWALASVAFVVLRDLATRELSENASSLWTALMATLAVTLAGVIGAAGSDWPPDMAMPAIKLFFCASILIFGLIFAVSAMRHGEVAVVAPFRYTAIIWAVILGYFVFGEVPDAWSVIGGLVVIGSGIFAFYREHVNAKKAAAL
jgi:drug/metabolite transporter (DMT)-like permease